jgi:hypothetical protein
LRGFCAVSVTIMLETKQPFRAPVEGRKAPGDFGMLEQIASRHPGTADRMMIELMTLAALFEGS